MKPNSPLPLRDCPRCRHLTPTGRRCRSLVTQSGADLCTRHVRRRSLSSPPSLTDALPDALGSFQSVTHVNHFLGVLLSQLARNQISPRRASVLAFITCQILQTMPQQGSGLDFSSAAFLKSLLGPDLAPAGGPSAKPAVTGE